MPNCGHQMAALASLVSACALLALSHWGALPHLVLTGGLMAGWRRQGDRSLPRPGARTSRRTANRSKSPAPRKNSSGKCQHPVRSAARYKLFRAAGVFLQTRSVVSVRVHSVGVGHTQPRGPGRSASGGSDTTISMQKSVTLNFNSYLCAWTS